MRCSLLRVKRILLAANTALNAALVLLFHRRHLLRKSVVRSLSTAYTTKAITQIDFATLAAYASCLDYDYSTPHPAEENLRALVPFISATERERASPMSTPRHNSLLGKNAGVCADRHRFVVAPD